MRYLVAVVTAVVVAAIATWILQPPDTPCAVSHGDSMGMHIDAGPAGYKIAWDTSCKNGMRWVKQ
jgi:hypothetical protein